MQKKLPTTLPFYLRVSSEGNFSLPSLKLPHSYFSFITNPIYPEGVKGPCMSGGKYQRPQISEILMTMDFRALGTLFLLWVWFGLAFLVKI